MLKYTSHRTPLECGLEGILNVKCVSPYVTLINNNNVIYLSIYSYLVDLDVQQLWVTSPL